MPGVRPKFPGGYKRKPVGERFFAQTTPEPMSGCLLWMGAGDHLGYGRFGQRSKVSLSHRVAWELSRGAIPDGLCVCHKCDNPSCVNVEHLFLGTQRENLADRDRKGRLWVGGKSKRRLEFESRQAH